MERFERELAQMSDLLLSGDYRTILQYFQLPIAIYAGSWVIVCSNEEHLLDVMGEYQLMFTEAGITSIDATSVVKPEKGHMLHTIWVEKTFRDAQGIAVETASLRYFVQISDDRPKICLVEYLTPPSMIDFGRLERIVRRKRVSRKLYAGSSREIGDVLPSHPA